MKRTAAGAVAGASAAGVIGTANRATSSAARVTSPRCGASTSVGRYVAVRPSRMLSALQKPRRDACTASHPAASHPAANLHICSHSPLRDSSCPSRSCEPRPCPRKPAGRATPILDPGLRARNVRTPPRFKHTRG